MKKTEEQKAKDILINTLFKQLEHKSPFIISAALFFRISENVVRNSWWYVGNVSIKHQEEVIKKLKLQIEFDKKVKEFESKLWQTQ